MNRNKLDSYRKTRNSITLNYPCYEADAIHAKVQQEIEKLDPEVFEISQYLECEGDLVEVKILGDRSDIAELDRHFNIIFADDIAVYNAFWEKAFAVAA